MPRLDLASIDLLQQAKHPAILQTPDSWQTIDNPSVR
jgi:hypothetical protein